MTQDLTKKKRKDKIYRLFVFFGNWQKKMKPRKKT